MGRYGWAGRTSAICASAVQALEADYTRVEVAELYSLGLSSIGRFIRRKRETGRVSPDRFGGDKRSSLNLYADLVYGL
jgi:transposase